MNLQSKLFKLKAELLRWYIRYQRILLGYPTKETVAITDSIFVGGQFRPSKLSILTDWGITGIISMRQSYPPALDQQNQIQFLNLPTTDRQAPSLEQLQTGVTFIQNQINQGGKVYIHCKQGEGRAPTMAAAYFINQGMTVNDAIDTILKVRAFLRITPPQIQRLNQYHKQLASY